MAVAQGRHIDFAQRDALNRSEDVGERFHLFRVFDFGRAPRAYVLAGPLRERCRLEPTLFRATI